MSIRRVLTAPLFVLLGLLAAAPAQAAPVAATMFPLRVHLFDGDAGHHAKRPSKAVGRANVIEGDAIHGLVYRSHCDARLAASKAGTDYAARWTKPGQILELSLGSDPLAPSCEVQVVLQKTVYVRQRNRIRAVSLAEYSELEGEPVQKGLSKRDRDPLYYPLELDVMTVRWRTGAGTPTGNGQGNLKTDRGPQAVDFTITCPTKLDALPDGQYYRARWRREHYEMTVLIEAGDASSVCVLNATVEPAVYVRQAGGTLQAVPLALYRKLLIDDANVTSRY